MQSNLLTGRLTTDPLLTYTPEIAKCTFVLAVASNHNGYKTTDFIPCVAWRQQAELLGNFARKGQKIEVKGYIRSRTFTSKGQKVSYIEFEIVDAEY
ncbi:single-stranded DNA-binding protein [Lysinibacillus fusiformis]|uniref:single-stranded DNA-binding protein n=1 Tax=Lysinibacillus fusiformis TaxID=28031 RepID=UPI0021BFD34E|nr:single-stranded DNA-binding protein [Lysinibacillus fusiformis]UXJ71443.1 single-stranded DNA-binding protein [Lysinibacillus fusiformis]